MIDVYILFSLCMILYWLKASSLCCQGNIDGFRSNSDTSDEEDGPPNISAAVLRSSKKVFEKSENKCPGKKSALTGLQANLYSFSKVIEKASPLCDIQIVQNI